MFSKLKLFLYDRLIEAKLNSLNRKPLEDKASKSNSKGSIIAGIVTALGIRNGDSNSSEYQASEYTLSTIQTAYDADSYIRQGVDKYVDQVFKEGWTLYGSNPNTVLYIKQRLAYIALTTRIPTDQFLTDIAEDVVKYSNCLITKVRSNDATVLPPGATITGINGKQPIAGYFCINVTTMKVKRDKHGTIQGWQQKVPSGSETVNFDADDVIHIYYKREKGNCFGTPFLIPVLDDVRALRQAEEGVLKMMYRNIYPFYHVKVGTEAIPGTNAEVDEIKEKIQAMDVDGGLVTTNRVNVEAIASDKVIEASPYLEYLENRVFSGMGIPGIMFGRGDTANRSTGDDMTSEMSDRIKAIQKVIETFVNDFIIRELLMEGGFDPILNEDDNVQFMFKENDLDNKIKNENHAVFMYQSNTITEDEMRSDIGRDAITDRSKMFQTLVGSQETATDNNGTKPSKEANNKEHPANQYVKKTSPKKNTNNISIAIGLVNDMLNVKNTILLSDIENNDINSSYIVLSDIYDEVKFLIDKLGIQIKVEDVKKLEANIKEHSTNLLNTCGNNADIKNKISLYMGLIKDEIVTTLKGEKK